jgi:hypothetical protein
MKMIDLGGKFGLDEEARTANMGLWQVGADESN